jgi:hypothetical protein
MIIIVVLSTRLWQTENRTLYHVDTKVYCSSVHHLAVEFNYEHIVNI